MRAKNAVQRVLSGYMGEYCWVGAQDFDSAWARIGPCDTAVFLVDIGYEPAEVLAVVQDAAAASPVVQAAVDAACASGDRDLVFTVTMALVKFVGPEAVRDALHSRFPDVRLKLFEHLGRRT